MKTLLVGLFALSAISVAATIEHTIVVSEYIEREAKLFEFSIPKYPGPESKLARVSIEIDLSTTSEAFYERPLSLSTERLMTYWKGPYSNVSSASNGMQIQPDVYSHVTKILVSTNLNKAEFVGTGNNTWRIAYSVVGTGGGAAYAPSKTSASVFGTATLRYVEGG